jgi:hypothetical protein
MHERDHHWVGKARPIPSPSINASRARGGIDGYAGLIPPRSIEIPRSLALGGGGGQNFSVGAKDTSARSRIGQFLLA